MATYLYLRCSHRDSIDGVSIAAQESFCRTFASQNELHVSGVFVDPGVSAFRKDLRDRPGGSQLTEALVHGDTVLVYSIDRGFRSVRDFGYAEKEWSQRGVTFTSARENIDSESPQGRMLIWLIVWLSEMKSQMISARTKAGQAARKKLKGNELKRVRKTNQKRIRNDAKSITKPAHSPVAVRVREILQQSQVELEPPVSGRVLTYIRGSHSTSNTASQRFQIEEKLRRIQAESLALEVLEFNEGVGVSAYRNDFSDRPVGRKLSSEIRRGDIVLVGSFARAFRSVRDASVTIHQWDEAGARLMFGDCDIDTGTMCGRLMLHVLSFVAEWESAELSARMQSIIRQIETERGFIFPNQYHSQSPWGCDVETANGRIRVVDPQRIRELWHMRLMQRHGMSLNAIADHVELIHSTREGRPLLPRTATRRGAKRYPLNSRTRQIMKEFNAYRRYCSQTVKYAVEKYGPHIEAICEAARGD